MSALINAYNRLAITLERGEGARVWDTDGTEYLDALGGIAVTALGHSHPAVTAAITEQAAKLIHTSNVYQVKAQADLGEKLCSVAGMDKVFFSNSGAEANEAMIKIARLHARKREIDSPAIVVMEGSFHGRTMATLSATGSRKVQAGFEPLVQGFVRVPFNDVDSLKAVAENNPHVVAVMFEPIQGEGGIVLPDDDYIDAVRAVCDEHNWLMMLDEIQSGMGRTGKWFAYQHSASTPDVMSVAKALGNGVPIGACLASGDAAELIQPGNHGSTFGGNPLSCRVGGAVIDAIENDKLLARAQTLGARLLDGFKAELADVSAVTDIRGRGMMLGIQFDRDCPELVGKAMQAGILINVTRGDTIRLLPPYVMSDAQADTLVGQLSAVVKDALAT
ncbi:MAG: aspartate aminotransferase family protein [Pseudomonadota bacterium]